jgi:acyl carrier protein
MVISQFVAGKQAMSKSDDPELIESLRHIINEVMENKEGADKFQSINPEMSLSEDIGLESLDLADMTVRIEDRFGVDVFEDEVVETVDDVLEKIDEK